MLCRVPEAYEIAWIINIFIQIIQFSSSFNSRRVCFLTGYIACLSREVTFKITFKLLMEYV